MISDNKYIYALGVGSATPVFCETAMACGYNVAGLYHYNSSRNGEIVSGIKILGSFDDLFNSDISGIHFLLTMGDPMIRHELFSRLKAAGGIIPTIIHPTAVISSNCVISSDGVIIGPLSVIESNAKIEGNVAIWDMALICHDAIVESDVFIGPKALVGAAVHVNSFAYIGQGAILISHKAKDIGRYAIVGAGSVVTKSIDGYHVVAGMPAKTIKEIVEES